MLQPSSRRLLLDGLRPSGGYRLDRAVGTSYTLDLLALLTAPLAFTFFDWEDEKGRPMADPLALLEAVRRHAQRIHLFCQAGRVKVPAPGQTLLAYLEDSVFEVEAPHKGGVFHPKVWLLRYVATDDGEPVRYRLLCLSRNLTFDRSWDTALVLDGHLTKRRNAFGVNRPLGEFFSALPKMTLHPLPAEVASGIEQMQDEVRRVEFELPEGFEEVAFHPLGIHPRALWPFPKNRRPCVIVSPFVTSSTIDRIAARRKRVVLVSRPEELERLPRKTLHDLEVYTLAEEANADAEGTEVDLASEGNEATISGLHAKLFVIDDGWNACVWTGSANATVAAFQRNVEFLVELVGKKTRVGIDVLLGEGGVHNAPTLRDLLQPFTPSGDVPPSTDEAKAELERRLNVARSQIAAAKLTAKVLPNADDRTYSIDLVRRSSGAIVPAGCSVRVWPTSLRFDASVALEARSKRRAVARFEMLSFAALTSFFAFEINTSYKNQDAQVRFALNLPLEGAPEDRREGLLRALLQNRDQVMRLLWILLSEGELSASDFVAAAGGSRNRPGQRGFGDSGFPLLESLLKALGRDPGRLDEVARLIADLRRTPEGQDLLPDGLNAIWDPIWAVREEQTRESASDGGGKE